MAGGELVLVEQHLFGPTFAWAAAVDRVLTPLDRAREVGPRPVGNRRRVVGLLDARADLLVDPVAQFGDRRERGLRVCVLRLEVRDHVRVVAFAQPVPVVDAIIAVNAEYVRAPGCPGRRRPDHYRGD